MFVDSGGHGRHVRVGLGGSDGYLFLEQDLVAGLEQDGGGGVIGGGVEAELRFATGDIQIDRGIEVGFLHAADVAERIPVHAEGFGFVGLKPAIVGLIVGIGAHHQFDVRAIVVGQDVVPLAAGGAIAPGPQLLAGHDVVVGDGHDAGFAAVVVAGEEIVFVVPGKDGIRGDVVLVPTDVDAFGEIGAVVSSVGQRPFGELVFAVKGAVLGAGREEDLVVLIDVHGDVGEAEHGVDHRRAVGDAQGRFQVCLAGAQRVTHGPAHARAQFQFADPDGFAAVGILFHFVLHGKGGGGAMMMRDVPFDAAGDPRADQTDQGRLDDVLAVDEVVAVGFVDALEEAAAYFRQDTDADELVLEIDDFVLLVLFFGGEVVVERIGVDAPLRSLRGLAEIEDRVGFRARR